MNIIESYNKLSEFSEIAKKMLEQHSTRMVNIKGPMHVMSEDITFHPNGKCGCIELNDEEMFDIRCNHLMWAEGTCEGTESFMEEIENQDSILIYGNHKGELVVKLLTFSAQ